MICTTAELRKAKIYERERGRLQIIVFLRERDSLGVLELSLVLCHQGGVDRDFCGCEGGSSDELQRRVAVQYGKWMNLGQTKT